eukprot:Gregarina_sp_Pseudo_9__5293@NODE_612_length_2492_cov_14_746025_g578_i0_p1_GENE_NODE_612_length_2492_cov_14_746025_g578_i0NODE_612_length_2492_cov_14_746025_g578_i0_p1_ORF_typecomplete_len453_score69_96Tam41_Mmp37/PF09139_11/3_1e51_NODE_612_length_2492_cov_14_746025_g578_i04661824
MPVHTEELRFPFNRFPPLKCAIAYGSVFMPASKAAKVIPSLPDFLLVVDESQASLAEWHSENMLLNKDHYSGRRLFPSSAVATFQTLRPKVFMSPLSILEFPYGKFGTVQKLVKYMVVTEKDLMRDLIKWDDFYLAGRLQKPSLFIFPDNSGLITGENAKISRDVGGTLGRAMKANLLNAIRLSLLLSNKDLTLRDLLRTTASLSFLGDSRCRYVDEALRARGAVTNNLLPYLSLYAPSIPQLRKEWVLRLEEGDGDILKGRYTPQQFREAQKAKEGAEDALRFDLHFVDPADEKVLFDTLKSVEGALRQHIKESYAARLIGETIPQQLSKELQDALAVLNKREMVMKQAFSSEAHCSLFHSLPDDIQMHSISVSARRRLGRIFSPFSLLDSARDRDILGGPLPWERTCVEPALERIVRTSSRKACLKGLLMAGPARAGFYGFQKWCGHLSA